MKNLNRVLIETTVRNTLRQIKNDPERSVRNLIDMGLHFSEGRFQHHFFEIAREMLRNDQSCYYRMIPDAVATIDTERIVTFGMNLGYNSCTNGAKTIRMIEEKEHFNIPWSISLEISGYDYFEKSDSYHSLIEQGQALGIYTWLLYSLDSTSYILELVKDFPDCAFAIFCSPGEITDSLLDEASAIYNLMFVVSYSNGVEKACKLLRAKGHLYSIFFSYRERDIAGIVNGNLLCDTEVMHPIFTAFASSPSCPLEKQEDIYQYILKTRSQQIYRTIPFDLVQDSRFIDGIISEEACSIKFDPKGNLYPLPRDSKVEHYNCFTQPLSQILKLIAPKKLASQSI